MDRGGVVQDFVRSLEQLSNPIMLFKVKFILFLSAPSPRLGKSVLGGACRSSVDTTAAGSGSTQNQLVMVLGCCQQLSLVMVSLPGASWLFHTSPFQLSPSPSLPCPRGQSSLIVLKLLQNYHLRPSL